MQNAAAGILTKTKKLDDITPVLRSMLAFCLSKKLSELNMERQLSGFMTVSLLQLTCLLI